MTDFIIEEGILTEYNGAGGDIVIPDGVEIIDGSVFSYCDSLKSIVISDSVESIGDNAFGSCKNLRSIVIGKGVTYIGECAFSDCPNLESIVAADGNPVYHSVDNCLVDTENKVLVLGCQNSSIPTDGCVESIGESAFSGCESLQNIAIPDCITVIDDWAFYGCKNLQSIEIPAGVTSIGNYVFYNCTELKSISMPVGITSIGKYAFCNCTNLKSIIIPAGVREIERDAFEKCTNLQSIIVADGNPVYHSAGNCLIRTEEKTMVFGCGSSVIPNDGSVTHIDDHAFLYRSDLQSIVIPPAVTSIGEWVFENCENLESVTIPDSVMTIGEGTFANCRNIKKWVLLPESKDEEQCKLFLDVIGKYNLALPFLLGNLETNDILRKLLIKNITAKKFRTDYIPELIEKQETEAFVQLLSLIKKMEPEEIDGYMNFAIEKGAVEITNRLIEYKQKLYPPEKIAEIQEIEFEKSMGAREKTLADYRKDFKITKDGDFYVITGYKSENPVVEIPGTIKGTPVKIKPSAFSACQYIQNVYITDGLTEIASLTFCGCTDLQTVSIPASVTKINKNAFCSGQNDITIFAPEGSYAQKFAKKQKIKFQTI